jgi:CheY-like chemotaxis protein
MVSSNEQDPTGTGSSDYLSGLRVLLVEDSWHVAKAMQRLLEAFGAHLVGPVATVAEAERLVLERVPDIALVDINLRGGERAYDLIDRLHEQGIGVVVISGYEAVTLPPGKALAVLQKPVRTENLLAILHQVNAQKVAR